MGHIESCFCPTGVGLMLIGRLGTRRRSSKSNNNNNNQVQPKQELNKNNI